ncbi:autoinducer 2 ABC transporter substrate-binding protein [Acidisoma sp. C75]
MRNTRRTLITLAIAGGLFAAVSPAQAKEWRIGFVPKLIGIPYFNAMKEGLDKGGKAFGAKIIYQGPTTASVSGQAEIAQGMINHHLDAVGVSANSPTALEVQANRAKKAGILFYSSDSQVDGDAVSLRVSQANDQDIGFACADQVAQQIGGSGDIALVSGGPTATNLNVWIGYIKQRIAQKYPNIKIVSIQYAGEDISKATDLTAQLLSAYPHLKGIIGVNSTAVPGAAQAVLRAGLTGKVAVTGVTDPNTIRTYVNDGTVKSVVLWNPIDLGYLTVWGVVQELEHKPLQAQNTVPGLGTISYDAATKTLLLGKPLIIDKSNIGLNF